MEKNTPEIAEEKFREIVREFAKKGLTADQMKEVVSDVLVSEVMES
jgi:polyhydroxyalkanoate synthesis regulator phasin